VRNTSHILDVHGMTTTVDTFIYLQRDIEQSFQRLQTCSFRDQQEFDQHLRHLSCTIDDLQEIHRLVSLSSIPEQQQSINVTRPFRTSTVDLVQHNNEFEHENQSFLLRKSLAVDESNHTDTSRLSSNSIMSTTTSLPSLNEREDFIHRMKTQLNTYKTKSQPLNNATTMETIHLDPLTLDNETDDQRIRQQDEQLDSIHHSVVSLKKLTQNINFEINDHLDILDNLESNMIRSQNHAETLTRRTKDFLQTSGDSVAGHTCLFAIAIGLFFSIVILILFF
jgi:chromosome segregation ATPase